MAIDDTERRSAGRRSSERRNKADRRIASPDQGWQGIERRISDRRENERRQGERRNS